MIISEARTLAMKLMTKHELWGWELKFYHNTDRKLGYCDHIKQVIGLHRIGCGLNSREKIRDVILHEIAHALVGWEHAHDETWRQKALEIGCINPSPYVPIDFVSPHLAPARKPRRGRRYRIPADIPETGGE